MGLRNNNVSKQGIQDVYKSVILDMGNKGKDTSVLKRRLRQLILKDKKKDMLIVAESLLRDIIKEAEDFQDKGMSIELYYTVREFLDE